MIFSYDQLLSFDDFLNFGRAKANGDLFNAALITAVGSDNTAQASEFRFSVLTSGSMSEKLRIDSSGRVRIGLGSTTEGTVDSDDLTIATTGNTGMTIRSGTTSNGAIYFSDATSGVGEYAGFIDYDHNTNGPK